MTTPEQREAILSGLEEVAAFLREHPELPVSPYWALACHTEHLAENEEAGRAQVEAAAAVLGEEPTQTAHYRVSRKFGGVEYEVVHVSEQSRRDWRALMSYGANVTAEDAPPGQQEGGKA